MGGRGGEEEEESRYVRSPQKARRCLKLKRWNGSIDFIEISPRVNDWSGRRRLILGALEGKDHSLDTSTSAEPHQIAATLPAISKGLGYVNKTQS